ncbi:sigma-54 dependent transcriptional regulator [Halosquirtibacter xylanolyticus]|uniref:sigma-54-dependent transcriptional regulator n=1 Tax=Halosquirtibacter xylanolyticus TaxID=3374599 RepID=UPI0037480709|nr:sigma-54 dependent transcriptional regulator [Prolixibacteraceae bacterium]
MKKGNILIIDDNQSILTTLELLLCGEFHQVLTLKNPNLILQQIQEHQIDVVLLDMNFDAGINTGNEGIYWLSQITQNHPHVSVIMITAFGDIDLAVKTVKNGAFDFILKPWNNQKIITTIHAALKMSLSHQENRKLKSKTDKLQNLLHTPDVEIIGTSPAIKEVMAIAEKVAATHANVLITGENGTGKEVFAEYIHQMSHRKEELLVTVDMGAIAATLFESELFGHSKGAFTGANEERIGKFQAANKGTLFLDELGNLPLDLQSKLLSALQTRTVTKLGSNRAESFDVRLVCATNMNIQEMIQNGQFREDLYYRVNTIQIELPPLRRRGHDIILLANHFLKQYGKRYNKPSLHLSTKVQKEMLEYTWPGNIRELRHCMEKATILTDSACIESLNLTNAQASAPLELLDLDLHEMEKKLISQHLQAAEGNLSRVASKLGITRQTLYNKLKKHNL